MKTLLLITVSLTLFATTAAHGQSQFRPRAGYRCHPAPPIYVASPHHASTAAESYARGYAAMIQARAQYNLLTSIAATNLAEARRREMENHVTRVQTHYAAREINKSYRQANRRPARQHAATRTAKATCSAAAVPAKFSITGHVAWPVALQAPVFAPYRAAVDDILSKQRNTGTISHNDQFRLAEASRAMVKQLKKRVHSCSPQDYVDAKLVLKALPDGLKTNG